MKPTSGESREEGTGPIRVLVVDDHEVVRRGLRTYFEDTPDIEVVGEARNGREALRIAISLEPDVILMDLLMPEQDGIEATRAIRAELPDVEIVALTSFIAEEHVTAALEAGASGYLLKDAQAEDVEAAVRAAFAGEMAIDPAVTQMLAQRLRDRRQETLVEPLTEREREVLVLVGQGASNKEIGTALFITERTARTHVSHILGKLGLANRTQAALWAVDHGMVPPRP